MKVLSNAYDAVSLIPSDCDLIVSMANGEPVELMDAVEHVVAASYASAWHEKMQWRIHQMNPLYTRPSMGGEYGEWLKHYSYFLANTNRKYVGRGTEFVPCNFSAMPVILNERTRLHNRIVLASVTERDGYLYFGTNAEYVEALILEGMDCILEVNTQMPTTGRVSSLVPTTCESHILGVYYTSHPMVEVPSRKLTDVDRLIAEHIAERVPKNATLQIGIGNIPDMVLTILEAYDDPGDTCYRVHTELLTDGLAHFISRGYTEHTPTQPAVATFALGTQQGVYDFIERNPSLWIKRVDDVNNPVLIAQQRRMVSINATTEVDLYGQCASETMAGVYHSGSGGQLDFLHGIELSPDGQSFIALHSKTSDGQSRIKSVLAPGSVVTSGVHVVDKVVTEHGVAELRHKSLRERALALIDIAAPEHREELTFAANQRRLV